MFAPSFVLPNLDRLQELSQVDQLDEDGENIVLAIQTILKNHRYRQNLENVEVLDQVVSLIATHMVKNASYRYTRNSQVKRYVVVYSWNIVNQDRHEQIVRINSQPKSLIDLTAYFIATNIETYGIFTELYEQPTYTAFMTVSSQYDELMIIRDNTYEEADTYDRLFEENRQETLDKVFAENKNNKLIYNDKKELGNDDNNECKLCYGNSTFVCSNCHYPLCSDCIEHIRKSTGKCPCCQSFPLELSKIVYEEDGWNEDKVRKWNMNKDNKTDCDECENDKDSKDEDKQDKPMRLLSSTSDDEDKQNSETDEQTDNQTNEQLSNEQSNTATIQNDNTSTNELNNTTETTNTPEQQTETNENITESNTNDNQIEFNEDEFNNFMDRAVHDMGISPDEYAFVHTLLRLIEFSHMNDE